jgi:hypothetical protein
LRDIADPSYSRCDRGFLITVKDTGGVVLRTHSDHDAILIPVKEKEEGRRIG